jgi:hypothetical protein
MLQKPYLFLIISIITISRTTVVLGQLDLQQCDFCGSPKVVLTPNVVVQSPLLQSLGLGNQTTCGDLEEELKLPFTPAQVCSIFQAATSLQNSCGCGVGTRRPTSKPTTAGAGAGGGTGTGAPVPTSVSAAVPVTLQPTSKPTQIPVPVQPSVPLKSSVPAKPVKSSVPVKPSVPVPVRVPVPRQKLFPALVPLAPFLIQAIPGIIRRVRTTAPTPMPTSGMMSKKTMGMASAKKKGMGKRKERLVV